MTDRAASASQLDQVVRGLGEPPDNAANAAMPNGSAIVAPVTRDHRFQHYSPDRFSILRTASSSGERFEIRLQSLVHRDASQRLMIVPGKEIVTIGRDIRLEVHELAVVDLAWPQLVSLRDELTRAIAAAVPITPDEAAERLTNLTAQIAVTESQLSHLAWKAPEVAATPSAREFADLSDKIGMLVDRLEPRGIARRRASDRSKEEAVETTRGQWTTYLGVALCAGLIGLLTWSLADERPRDYSRRQPNVSEQSSMALRSSSGDPRSGVRASPMPSAVRAGGAATSMGAPEPAQGPESPVRLPAERPTDAAISSRSDGQPTDATGVQEPPPSLGAATLLTTAPPSKESKEEPTGSKAEPAVTVPSTLTAPLPATGADMPEVRTAEGAILDPVDTMSASSKAAASHVAIHVTAKTWLRVRDGAGRVYIARLLKAGETWPVPAIEGLVLTSGNGGSTFILVDGVSGPALGAEGVVRTEKLP